MQSFKLKFSGVTILQGVEFPIFLLIFEWALQQCSATALPVISRIWGEAPTLLIRTKICVVGSLPDVITYAKFRVEIFRGYDFTGGRIFPFPIDF